MTSRLITLTTDFGDGSPYVAAMKGVLLGIHPRINLVDVCHRVPAQDLRYASFLLRAALPYFPAETIHVIVVDPGVGTDRALLLVEVSGHTLLVPDNGCWTALAEKLGEPPAVFKLAEPRFWRAETWPTFHGRDILAPVAAHLSLGVAAREFGPSIGSWTRLEIPAPIVTVDEIVGEVVFVDTFGNLISNIPGQAIQPWRQRGLRVEVGSSSVSRVVATYGEAPPGSVVALISSAGTLEIAVACGNAARLLSAEAGTAVRVKPQ
jgi:S-adenosylmethionine hydrolase